MVPPPVAIALTLCEQTIFEEGTRNLTLVNTFRSLFFDRFPSPPKSFFLVGTLTDGLGDGRIEAVILREDTDAELFSRPGIIHFPSRLAEVRVRIPVADLSFPTAGAYQVALVVDGEWIAHRRLFIKREVDRDREKR